MAQTNRTPPSSIVLLGMHRSGTSALAKSLGELGAWLGSPEHVTRRSENSLVQDCNQAILDALGGHWSAPPPLPTGWMSRPELAGLDADARAAIADLERHAPNLSKDPRTSLTLAYWRARLKADPVVVVSYRHPLEVAASLERRDGFQPGHALALWERYNRALLESARGLPCVVVAYSDLVTEPVATLSSLREQLAAFDVTLAGDAGDAAAAVDSSRRHHVFAELPDDVTTPQQRELWDALCALPATAPAFVPPELREPHAASTELLAERAARLSAERDLAGARGDLRSRRTLVRELARRVSPSPRRR